MSAVLRWSTLVAACSAAGAACGVDAGEGPVAPPGTTAHPLDDVLHLSDVQVLGTHNSYHLAPDVIDADPFRYSHAPLHVQAAEQGVRQFELDVYLDEERGDLRVFHIGVVDDRSTCSTLRACLSALASFSQLHPGHLPLVIALEPKTPYSPARDPSYLDAIEAAALDAFDRDQILTPDDVRAGRATLADAIATDGWPTLARVRGRVIFLLFDEGEWATAYASGGETLAGRLMFLRGAWAPSLTAFVKRDDPILEGNEIMHDVTHGLLVRTRADDAGLEARENDVGRFEVALARGAHFISTDYPAQTEDLDYFVQIPGGTPARCNPITAPPHCTSTALEDPGIVFWDR